MVPALEQKDISGVLMTPTLAQWQEMSPEAQKRAVEQIVAALEEQVDFMSESRPHSRAKNKAMDKLGRYFQRIGKLVYLASELPLLYPGMRAFKPDLMAVLGVEDPGEEDTRTAWTVAVEGKGADLILEVYYSGDEHKDFVDNVEDYAQAGVTEYFIYDRRRQALHGYRLASPGAKRYQKMKARFGRLSSAVLGLDLFIFEGRLRFLHGDAELPDSDELIARVEGLVDDLQRRRDDAEARASEAEARASEIAARASEAEAKASEAEARVRHLFLGSQAMVLDLLTARGLAVSDPVREQVAACEDIDLLRRWALRALTAATAEEILL